MKEEEIEIFIEKMEEIGDIWDPKDVKRVYGNRSLQDALDDRMSDMATFANIIKMVINS